MPYPEHPSPPEEVGERIEQLIALGEEIIEDANTAAGGKSLGLFVDYGRIEELVHHHFSYVNKFKSENDFPDKERVSFPKVATFTALHILHHKPIV